MRTISNFCSGWDIHDAVYSRELLISNKDNGYRDVIAKIDLSTYRRIPWEGNVPFFLVSFLDPETKEPLSVCPRSVLHRTAQRAEEKGWSCFAGVEYEACRLSSPYIDLALVDFCIPSTSNSKVCTSACLVDSQLLTCGLETPNTLAQKQFTNLDPLTPGSWYFSQCCHQMKESHI